MEETKSHTYVTENLFLLASHPLRIEHLNRLFNDMKRLFKFGKSKNLKSLTTDALGREPATAASMIAADPILSVPASSAVASAQSIQAAGVTVSFNLANNNGIIIVID